MFNRFKYFLLFLLILCTLAAARLPAQQRWTKTNTILLVSSSAMILMDYSSSLAIPQQPTFCCTSASNSSGIMMPTMARRFETNPFLPKYPTVTQLTIAAGVGLTSNYIIARLLPNPWRNISLGIVTAFEAYMVYNNVVVFQSGFHIPF